MLSKGMCLGLQQHQVVFLLLKQNLDGSLTQNYENPVETWEPRLHSLVIRLWITTIVKMRLS